MPGWELSGARQEKVATPMGGQDKSGKPGAKPCAGIKSGTSPVYVPHLYDVAAFSGIPSLNPEITFIYKYFSDKKVV